MNFALDFLPVKCDACSGVFWWALYGIDFICSAVTKTIILIQQFGSYELQQPPMSIGSQKKRSSSYVSFMQQTSTHASRPRTRFYCWTAHWQWLSIYRGKKGYVSRCLLSRCIFLRLSFKQTIDVFRCLRIDAQ